MTSDQPVLGVHGIWNTQPGLQPAQAAARLGEQWTAALAVGYRDAGLGDPAPAVVGTYYAHVLADDAQGGIDDLSVLTPYEQDMAWAWMRELGVPQEAGQGVLTVPLRQGLSWLARREGRPQQVLARVMTAFLREVYTYLTRPAARASARAAVIEAVRVHRPRVLVAHSLGSVVAYEALHEATDTTVDLFVTLGSPLGLPGAVFEAIDPPPRDGRGHRPPSVGRWVNIADPGDLVATPTRLGGRFDVDLHAEAHIGAVDFHTMRGYLSCGLVAAAVAPYA
ncbi:MULTISPECIES: hypothetical protein [unclassified Micromonospora]|uniref:hypothetical protein n=1 Tax=unclassified Micromonospora TaxID=2617518 RepID=UPI0036426868